MFGSFGNTLFYQKKAEIFVDNCLVLVFAIWPDFLPKMTSRKGHFDVGSYMAANRKRKIAVIEKKREANALRIKLARLDKKVSRLGIEINTSFSLDLS